MLLQYFGFKQEPFGATPDPRRLFPSQTHREALASLEYGFRSNRGFTAMIAPPGMGKTTLLFRFLESIRESARSVFLFDIDAECEPRDFVGHILRDIGITPGKTNSEMHQQLIDALAEETRAGRKFVIMIDEAQNLSEAVLERVRLLSNFETSQCKLMQIVLSGQPQLFDKLIQPSLVQFRQRIWTVCRIDPLAAEETVAYIEYGLKQAGYNDRPLFKKDALKLIAAASQGIPRTINNLCFNALSLCCAMKSKQVDDRMVAEVIADLQLIPQSGRSIAATSEDENERSDESHNKKWPARLLKHFLRAVAALVVLCVPGILGPAGLKASVSHWMDDERSSDQWGLPASVAAPIAADAGETKAKEPTRSSEKLQTTAQPDRRLGDIAVQCLGGYDLQRLHQIQALNRRLTNPDHIEVGQKIQLLGRPPVSLARDATPQASERMLP